MHQTDHFYSLILLNASSSCQTATGPPFDSLLLSYRIICLTLGPINALLNGTCVHIFKHSVWKQSAMSRLLKGLSVIELCMGICLFVYALLDHCTSRLSISTDKMGNTLENNLKEYSLSADRQQNYTKHVALFLLSIGFSLCLLAFHVARNWSVVLLAAYRYDRLCRPIGSGTAFPKERICKILLTLVGCSCVLVIPRAFEAAIVLCGNTGLYAGTKPILSSDRAYQIAYLGVVMFIVQSGGPVICVCVLNASIIRLIVKRREIQRQKEEKSALHLLNQRSFSAISEQPKDSIPNTRFSSISRPDNCVITQKLTPSGDKLIFAVCICFFIFETPAFFSKILNPYLEPNYPMADLWLSIIANMLIYLDSTLNAFVYMASNPTFRAIVAEKLLPYRKIIFGSRSLSRSVQIQATINEQLDE